MTNNSITGHFQDHLQHQERRVDQREAGRAAPHERSGRVHTLLGRRRLGQRARALQAHHRRSRQPNHSTQDWVRRCQKSGKLEAKFSDVARSFYQNFDLRLSHLHTRQSFCRCPAFGRNATTWSLSWSTTRRCPSSRRSSPTSPPSRPSMRLNWRTWRNNWARNRS